MSRPDGNERLKVAECNRQCCRRLPLPSGGIRGMTARHRCCRRTALLLAHSTAAQPRFLAAPVSAARWAGAVRIKNSHFQRPRRANSRLFQAIENAPLHGPSAAAASGAQNCRPAAGSGRASEAQEGGLVWCGLIATFQRPKRAKQSPFASGRNTPATVRHCCVERRSAVTPHRGLWLR